MKRQSILAIVAAASVAAFVASASAYDVKPGKGGSIKGKVLFKGDASKANAKIKPDKDAETCAEHCAPDFTVGDGGGLANAVVYLKDKDVKSGKDFPDAMKKATVDQVKCVYTGHVTFVMKGGEVAFRNSDKVLHNIKATSSDYNFNEGVEAGKDLVKKFDKPGEIKLACSIHAWMSGSVWVVPHPYYTATNDKGEFELTDIPAGKYTVLVKHGKLGKPAGAEKGIELEVKEGADATHDFEYTKAD